MRTCRNFARLHGCLRTWPYADSPWQPPFRQQQSYNDMCGRRRTEAWKLVVNRAGGAGRLYIRNLNCLEFLLWLTHVKHALQDVCARVAQAEEQRQEQHQPPCVGPRGQNALRVRGASLSRLSASALAMISPCSSALESSLQYTATRTAPVPHRDTCRMLLRSKVCQ